MELNNAQNAVHGGEKTIIMKINSIHSVCFKNKPGYKTIDPRLPLRGMYVGEDYDSDIHQMSNEGIYLIKYDCGMFYIGKSVNIRNRFTDHVILSFTQCDYFKKNIYYLNSNTWPPNVLRMCLAIIRNENIVLHIIDNDINNEALRIKHMCNDNMLNITHNVYKKEAISGGIYIKNKINQEIKYNSNSLKLNV